MSMYQLSKKEISNNILSGLTVALALIPEAIAFALIAKVEPLVGLYAAFIVGLVTSLFGGKPGMISGATGALAVVMVALVSQLGVEYLFATVILMGVLQILAGIFNLGKFVKMVPYPVMIGFVNGLAIVIMLAQFQQFKIDDTTWLSGAPLYTMIGLTILTMVIIKVLPKFTKVIPSALAAIIATSLIVSFLGIETKTVGDMASISGSLPTFHIPDIKINPENLKTMFSYAVILSLIGLIESLLTLKLLEEKTNRPGSYKKECIAQGLANLVTGFFGGMGGCAMIGQSMINVNSGGTSRLSAFVASIFLISFILVGSDLISMIPIAALIGVMFVVVINTFDWSTFDLMSKLPKTDAAIIVVVTLVTVVYDLAVAVMVGVILSSLCFVWKYSSVISHKAYLCKETGEKVYKITGTIFFNSITEFISFFDPKNDPKKIVLDLRKAKIFDGSAIETIKRIQNIYSALGKRLEIINVNDKCMELLTKGQ